jgi:hydroxyacylglutathione hydrolase
VKIDAIDAFSDNIIWAFEGPLGGCFVVDPGDAAPVLQYLSHQRTWLEGVLITHHHQDHVGGLERLQADAPRAPGQDALSQVPVYGPSFCEKLGVNHPVQPGSKLPLGPNGPVADVLGVPGHTEDHLAYVFDLSPPVLFSGDTLFAGGCGRLLGGSAEQLYASLNKLQALPGETLIYCAHEYTLSNLQFAAHTFPQVMAITDRLSEVMAIRKEGGRTLPSQLARERETNPFLLVRSLDAFRELRLQKDAYRAPPLHPNPN